MFIISKDLDLFEYFRTKQVVQMILEKKKNVLLSFH